MAWQVLGFSADPETRALIEKEMMRLNKECPVMRPNLSAAIRSLIRLGSEMRGQS